MDRRKIIYLDDALDALEKVARLFPYRVPGNRDTYDRYNEAWNDAIGRAEIEIEELPSAQPEPCEDAVSREAVSEWLKQYGQDVLHGKYKFSLMYIWKNLMDLPFAQPEIIRCKDCKYWRQQTNYAGAPLSFGFCESDYMWRSLYGETYEVSHIETDDDFYCGFAERREE